MQYSNINITLTIETHNINNFESWLREQLEVIDFKVLPDTSDLYNNDDTFRKLTKTVRDAQLERDRYYNDKR